MGEEKPEEELMGKSKSSPRLSTTSLQCRHPLLSTEFENLYTSDHIFSLKDDREQVKA